MQKIYVNTSFDAGSIEVVDISNPNDLQFKIRADTNSDFKQWFYFQLSNVKNRKLNIKFLDVLSCSFPDGFKDFRILMSYDNENWVRLGTTLDNRDIKFTFSPEFDSVYFAYFEPYSYTRHLALISRASANPLTHHQVIGQTREGRNMDMLTIGNLAAKRKVWVIARQHPGETMAEWFMEGLINKLLTPEDIISRTLLNDCVFYLVPNMNPDGAYNGNLRVNTCGINLNREWVNPSLDKSPEVYYVREMMEKTGVDVFFDIHGDENLPYVFTAGCDEVPSFSDTQAKLAAKFTKEFMASNPNYQTKFGYPRGRYSAELMTLATNWVGEKFGCLAYTLEMPFKDNANLPDTHYGWSGKKSAQLGADWLHALYATLCQL